VTARPVHPLRGTVLVPGDKSIGHRACLLASLAVGRSEIIGLSDGGDNRSTRACLTALGVRFRSLSDGALEVEGRGLSGLNAPDLPLDCGNSGTTMRLLMGLLAGRTGEVFTLVGDDSLSRRPMERVAAPLRRLGAGVETSAGGRPPVVVRGTRLAGGRVEATVASAQVKSAVLLAGLHADGPTTYVEPVPTRDHTERMLGALGVPLTRHGDAWTLEPVAALPTHRWRVPGDPSSAAFWCAAALLVPGSRIEIPGVCLNPTRTGFLRVLARMGAPIETTDLRTLDGEPTGTLIATHGALRGTRVDPGEVPGCIDELPMLALLASVAEGPTEVRGAEELSVKESDRIAAMTDLLRADGADARALPDGWLIAGGHRPSGGFVAHTRGDHRIALCAALLDAAAPREVRLDAPEAVDVSYPGFQGVLARLRVTASPFIPDSAERPHR
jgi:3-phosphoshikimate 1-carboxyvinyltransferase